MKKSVAPLVRLERNIEAIERAAKEMRYSLKVYASDPGKYEPQLENLAQAAHDSMTSSRAILRFLGAED